MKKKSNRDYVYPEIGMDTDGTEVVCNTSKERHRQKKFKRRRLTERVLPLLFMLFFSSSTTLRYVSHSLSTVSVLTFVTFSPS